MRIAQFLAAITGRVVVTWRRAGLRGLCLLAALLGAQPALASGSMRCGNRIVDEGNLAAELIAACGAPSFRDQWVFGVPGQNSYVAETEVWTYDFGPSQLLRLIKLRDGQIIDIETDGYGFPKGGEGHCSPRDVVEGLSKYRLVSKCGEPFTKRSQNAYRTLPSKPQPYRYGPDAYGGDNQYLIPTYREEWVYNFGRSTPLRRVILEDGWITNVELLNSGFDPR